MASGEIRLFSTMSRQMPVLAQSGVCGPCAPGPSAGGTPSQIPYYLDPSGTTVQLGVSGSIDAPWGAFVIGVGFAIDGSGNVALYGEMGGGVATSPDGSLNFVARVSDAASVDDLGGAFTNISAGGGLAEHAAGEAFFGTGTQGQPVQGTGFSVGVGAGAASSATYTGTAVTPSVNIWQTFLSEVCSWAICGF